MELATPKQRCSIAEYLLREQTAVEKHEYRDGEALLIAGGTIDHSLIIMNFGAALHERLKGKPCRVFDSNLRVRIARTVLYTYPDLTVICDPRQIDPDDPTGTTMTNPRLIVEVLSPSTEAYDRGDKFHRYLQCDSLEEYVLVSQASASVETFFRQPDGVWIFSPYSGLTAIARLRSLNLEVPLADIFSGIELPAAT